MIARLLTSAAALLSLASPSWAHATHDSVHADHDHLDEASKRMCGVDHPALRDHLRAMDRHMMAQTYHDEDESRKLQYSGPQAYDSSSFLLTLDQADAAGKLQPLRVTMLWEVVDNGDIDSSNVRRQCLAVGQTVTVRDNGGTETTRQCTAKMIVTGALGADRGSLMRARSEAARLFWQKTLKIRPVLDASITINPNIVSQFSLTTTSVANTDLVIIMTARPSPILPVAGYASVLQRDQNNRPTVAFYNWVPELLNTDNPNGPDVISSEMHTALHELVHALGGLNPVINNGGPNPTSMFLNSLGQPTNPSGSVYIQEQANNGARMVTKIKSKKVLNITREAYSCPTATGLPLEDVSLGAGSHWEARVMGPELMSYGSLSGQVYISDLTFAWLEDTGQYKANYSMGGKLSPDVVDDFKGYSLGVADAVGTAKRADYSPGWPRYGRGEGCGFLDGDPKATFPARYTCSKTNTYTCTADYRQSAVCIIKADFTSEGSTASSYIKEGDGTLGTLANQCSGSACPIPSFYRWFATDAEAAAASGVSTAKASQTGGMLNSMDYMPVPIGYWSCDSDTAAVNTTTASTVGLGNFASVFDLSTDTSKLGGQSRCPNCRCFESSLLEYTKGFSGPGILGTCMRANCYKSDYLQIGIRSQLNAKSTSWYKCPPEGGNLYVIGFSGHLVCPPAKDFCKQENTISGVKFQESSFLYEAIFWGIIAGIVLILFVTCICPCIRDRVINCLKRCCGALQFETLYDEVQRIDSKTGKSHRKLVISQSKRNLDIHGHGNGSGNGSVVAAASTGDVILSPPSPPKQHAVGPDGRRRTASPSKATSAIPTTLPWTCPSVTLMVVCIITLLAGCAMLGVTIWAIYIGKGLSIGISLLGTSCGVIIVSSIGLCASRKRAERGPSCWLLTFFFANILLLLVLIYTIAYGLGWNNWATFVTDNWDSISPYLPPSFKTGATETDQINTAIAAIKSNIVAVASVGIAVLLILLTGIVAAGLLVHYSTLAAMVTCICNNAFTLFGLIFSVVGFYLLAASGRAGGIVMVVATVIAAGLYGLTLGIIGIVAVFKKKVWLLGIYTMMVVGVVAFFSYCCWLFFTQGSAVANYVNGLTDAQLSTLSADLGLSLSKAQIVANLQDTMNQLAIASSVMLGVSACLLVSSIAYIYLVQQESREKELGKTSKSDLGALDVDRAAFVGAGAEAARIKIQQRQQSQRGMGGGSGNTSPVRTLRTTSVKSPQNPQQQAYSVSPGYATHGYSGSAGVGGAIAVPVPPMTSSASQTISNTGASSRALSGVNGGNASPVNVSRSPGYSQRPLPVQQMQPGMHQHHHHQYQATGSAPYTAPGITYQVGVPGHLGGAMVSPQMAPTPAMPLTGGYNAPIQASAPQFVAGGGGGAAANYSNLQYYRGAGGAGGAGAGAAGGGGGIDRSGSMRMKSVATTSGGENPTAML